MNPSTAPTSQSGDNAHRPCAGLWAGVIGAPAVWSLQFLLGYALAPWFCHGRTLIVMHFITAACVLAALFAALLCWREFKGAGGGSFEDASSGPIGRRRFMGGLGLFTSVLFAVVIVAQGASRFFFDGCWI